MTTVFPPRSPGNNWAYWKVAALKDLPAATKRRRNRIAFILTPEAAAAQPLTCVYCHHEIAEGDDKGASVYGEYQPKTRKAKVWHYTCGWGALLSDIIIDNRANRVLAPENIQL
jgi:hypothetical protein